MLYIYVLSTAPQSSDEVCLLYYIYIYVYIYTYSHRADEWGAEGPPERIRKCFVCLKLKEELFNDGVCVCVCARACLVCVWVGVEAMS